MHPSCCRLTRPFYMASFALKPAQWIWISPTRGSLEYLRRDEPPECNTPLSCSLIPWDAGSRGNQSSGWTQTNTPPKTSDNNPPIRPYNSAYTTGTPRHEKKKQRGGATHTVVDGHPVVEIGSVRAGRPASFSLSFPFPFHGTPSLLTLLPPSPRFFSLPPLHSPCLLLSPRTRPAAQFHSTVSSSDFPATSSPFLQMKFPTHPNQLRKARAPARPTPTRIPYPRVSSPSTWTTLSASPSQTIQCLFASSTPVSWTDTDENCQSPLPPPLLSSLLLRRLPVV